MPFFIRTKRSRSISYLSGAQVGTGHSSSDLSCSCSGEFFQGDIQCHGCPLRARPDNHCRHHLDRPSITGGHPDNAVAFDSSSLVHRRGHAQVGVCPTDEAAPTDSDWCQGSSHTEAKGVQLNAEPAPHNHVAIGMPPLKPAAMAGIQIAAGRPLRDGPDQGLPPPAAGM